MSSGRIGYLCTYTPGELIEAMGLVPYRFLPPPAREGAVDDLLDSNLCPYVRQIAGGLKNNCYPELEGIVIARSCEAALHLYNVFSEQAGCPVFLLDLPRKRNPASLNYFTRCLEELESWLQSLGGKLDHLLLQDKIEEYRETARLVDDRRNRVRGIDLFHLIGEYNGRPRGELNKALQQWIGTGEKVEKQVEEVLLLTGALPQQNLVNILEEERVIWIAARAGGDLCGVQNPRRRKFSRG